MVRALIIFLTAFIIYGCTTKGHHNKRTAHTLRIVSFENNLDNIPGYNFRQTRVVKRNPFKQKKLRLLVLNSINSYFVSNGTEYGLEYELLRLYAEEKGLTIELSVVTDIRSLYDSLYTGNYDLAIGTLIRSKAYDMLYPQSATLYETDIVVIQRKAYFNGQPKKLVTKVSDFPARSIGVVDNSPVYLSVKRMKGNNAISPYQFKRVGMGNNGEGLIDMVFTGELDYALVNKHEAAILSGIHPDLDFSLVVSRDVKCSVIINPYSAGLSKDFKSWLRRNKRSTDYAWIIIKYDSLYRDLEEKYSYAAPRVMAGNISRYDTLIVKYAKELNWDWRLLAAQIFQESRFDPNKKSWMGAIGLMQIMPLVGNKYGGVSSSHLLNPEVNIRTGVKYIKWLYEYYSRDNSINEKEKVKFVLAAYNAGVGHVQDARALAYKYGYSPNRWDNNVEIMMLNKSKPMYYGDRVCKYGYCRGREPVQYVKNILTCFQHYTSVVKH